MNVIAPSVSSETLHTLATLRAGAVVFGLPSIGGGVQKVPSAAPSSGSAASNVYTTWFQVSEPIRFFVSGNIGNVCFFFLERLVYFQLCNMNDVLPQSVVDYKESVSFFIGYLLQIVSQHLLNAVLVYGVDTIDTRAKYFKTLVGQSSAYVFSLFGSTFLNLGLLQAGLEKSTAFVSTLTIFACINYFVIGYIVRAFAGVEISEYPPVNTRTPAPPVVKKQRVRGGDSDVEGVFECDTSTRIHQIQPPPPPSVGIPGTPVDEQTINGQFDVSLKQD